MRHPKMVLPATAIPRPPRPDYQHYRDIPETYLLLSVPVAKGVLGARGPLDFRPGGAPEGGHGDGTKGKES